MNFGSFALERSGGIPRGKGPTCSVDSESEPDFLRDASRSNSWERSDEVWYGSRWVAKVRNVGLITRFWHARDAEDNILMEEVRVHDGRWIRMKALMTGDHL